MQSSDTILATEAEGVLTLTLNRPDKLNAFNDEMHLALRAGFERAHAEASIRAVLLTGAGRASAPVRISAIAIRKRACPISVTRSRPITIPCCA